MKKVLLVLGILVLAGAGFFIYKKYSTPPATTQTIPLASKLNTPSSQIPKVAEQNAQIEQATKSVPASIIIYKTKRDYSGLVLAYLSTDKTQVISYPAPKDISNEIPLQLHNGYFSGVLNANTAIINIKISSYERLNQALTPKQMFSLILNNSPFSEMYNCGQKGTDIDPAHLNSLIDANKLSSECDKVI